VWKRGGTVHAAPLGEGVLWAGLSVVDAWSLALSRREQPIEIATTHGSAHRTTVGSYLWLENASSVVPRASRWATRDT
jgi:hypothetical protein